jgi:Asp-tRNA(Asn)/Glu-tRNA(Gln) amidotransferase C subunit
MPGGWKKKGIYGKTGFPSASLPTQTWQLSGKQSGPYRLSAKKSASRMEAITGSILSLAEMEVYSRENEALQYFLHTVGGQSQWDIFKQLLQSRQGKEADTAWLAEARKKLLGYLQMGIEQTLPTEDLAAFLTMLAEARKARTGFFSWLFWQWFSSHKQQVASIAEAKQLSLSREDLDILQQKVENRIALEELLKKIQELRPVEKPYEPAYISQWFDAQQRAIELKNLLNQSPSCNNTPTCWSWISVSSPGSCRISSPSCTTYKPPANPGESISTNNRQRLCWQIAV